MSYPINDSQIKQRSLHGVRWMTMQTIVIAMLGPVSQILKARYLNPTALAGVAIVMILSGLFRTIANAGMSQTIIQKPELDSKDRFMYFLVALVVSTAGSLLLVSVAESIERLFEVEHVKELVILLWPFMFLTIWEQYLRALLHRELLFRGVAIAESVRRTINLVLLFIFLNTGFDSQSVVFALLVSTLFKVVTLLFLVVRHRLGDLHCIWKATALRHLVSVGMPIAGKQFLTYTSRRADEIIVGLVLSTETLGLYHLAKETLHQLQTLIVNSFGYVLLPLFSRICHDRSLLTNVYSRVSLAVSYIVVPVFVGIALTAPDVIPAVFGHEWVGAVYPFQMLSIAMIPIIISANLTTSLNYALGKAKKVLFLEIAVSFPYLAVLYISRFSGLTVILGCILVYNFLYGLCFQLISNRSLSLTVLDHFLIYIRVLTRVLVMALAIIGVRFLIAELGSSVLRAALTVGAGFISMVTVTYLSDRKAISELRVLVSRAKR